MYIVENGNVYKEKILIGIMKQIIRFDKERKKEFVTIKCPDCHQEISGTSQIQAEAMLKEHRRSTLHKKIIQSFNSAEASGSITRNIIKQKEGGKK